MVLGRSDFEALATRRRAVGRTPRRAASGLLRLRGGAAEPRGRRTPCSRQKAPVVAEDDEVELFRREVQTFATKLEREIHTREKRGVTSLLARLSVSQLTRLRWWVRIF